MAGHRDWGEPTERSRGSDFLDLRGKTVDEIVAFAVRAAFQRHAGNRRLMMLGVRSTVKPSRRSARFGNGGSMMQ